MKTTQQYKELHNVEIMKEKQNESDDTRIYEILSKYSTWFMKNNIEEFQMFSKFWNKKNPGPQTTGPIHDPATLCAGHVAGGD